jgi:hypothetical protein
VLNFKPVDVAIIARQIGGYLRFLFKTLALVALCGLLDADPIVHKFELWGKATKKTEKLLLYWGWTNGFVIGKDFHVTPFSSCLESMTPDQAIAMVDKYYTDHPEQWSQPLGLGIIEALTVANSPCEGKHPLPPAAKR